MDQSIFNHPAKLNRRQTLFQTTADASLWGATARLVAAAAVPNYGLSMANDRFPNTKTVALDDGRLFHVTNQAQGMGLGGFCGLDDMRHRLEHVSLQSAYNYTNLNGPLQLPG